MRRNVRMFGAALMAVIVILSLSGITFSKLENTNQFFSTDQTEQDSKIKLIYENKEEEVETAELKPGYWYEEAVRLQNESKEPVFLRIHLQMTEIDSKEMFRLGVSEKNSFVTLNSTLGKQGNRTEYWEKVGDYLYYRNEKTENQLKAGKKTIPVYEAVQLNENIPVSSLALLREQSVIITAETSAEEWADFDKGNE